MNIGQETEQVEFKKSTGELKEGVISLASMLNKHAYGTLWFGVKNNGDIVGQEIGDNTLRDISQAIAVGIKPAVIPTISLQLMDDKNIIRVDASGAEKPYSAYGRYYMRSADEDREMTPAQLRDTMLAGSAASMTSMEAENQDLSFMQLQSLYAARGLTVQPETFSFNTGLKTSKGTYNLLAELLADNTPYSVKVARFEGKDKSKLLMRNEYGYKCLILAMQQAMDYVGALNETRVEMNGALARREEQLFDMDCFREAWVNACLHNKWTGKVSPSIYLYDDRMEIVSSGGLPADYSPEEFFAGISHPVNIGLQKIMGQLDIVEQTGHGVPLIVKRYGRNVFQLTENHIIVTIPFAFERNLVSNVVAMSKSQSIVLRLIRDNPAISIEELAAQGHMSRSGVNQAIRKLKDVGILTREGNRVNGKWVVK